MPIYFALLFIFLNLGFLRSFDNNIKNYDLEINLLENIDSQVKNYFELYNLSKKNLKIIDIFFDLDVFVLSQDLDSFQDFKEQGFNLENVINISKIIQQKNKYKKIVYKICCFKAEDKLDYKANLIIELNKFWIFTGVNFTGEFFGQEYLMQLYSCKNNERFDFDKHKISVKKIDNYLKSIGYLDAIVKDNINFDSLNKNINIEINIDKKTRFKVSSINLNILNIDKNIFSFNFIENLNKNYKNYILRKLGCYYSKDLVNELLYELKRYLIFFNYNITIQDIIVNKYLDYKNRNIKLIFDLDILKLKKYNFSGNLNFSKTQLFEVLDIFADNLNFVPAEFLAEELLVFYKNNGFIDVEIEFKEKTEQIQDKAQNIEIDFNIIEGPKTVLSDLSVEPVVFSEQEEKEYFDNASQVKFGKTYINGCVRTSNKILQKQLEYHEGDFWSQEKLNKSIKNLKKLGVFQEVSCVSMQDIFAQDILKNDSKPIIFNVLEYPRFQLDNYIGLEQVSKNASFRDGFTPILGLSFFCNNFSGNADLLKFNSRITRFQQAASVEYFVPYYYLDNLIDMAYKNYFILYEQPVKIDCKYPLYRAVQNGILLNYKYEAFRNKKNIINYKLNLGVEYLKIKDLREVLAKVIRFEPSIINKFQSIFICEPAFSLINNIDTSYSSFLNLLAKLAVPLNCKSTGFIKFRLDEYYCWPFFYKILASCRISAGHIFVKDFKKLSPLERFYLGGTDSLRGYEPDFAPPLGCYKLNNTCQKWLPIGGSSMINSSVELKFLILQNLKINIFLDTGILKNSLDSCFSATSGCGLCYDTPVGPVKFDIGWKWFKIHEFENRYSWYLTLGQIF